MTKYHSDSHRSIRVYVARASTSAAATSPSTPLLLSPISKATRPLLHALDDEDDEGYEIIRPSRECLKHFRARAAQVVMEMDHLKLAVPSDFASTIVDLVQYLTQYSLSRQSAASSTPMSANEVRDTVLRMAENLVIEQEDRHASYDEKKELGKLTVELLLEVKEEEPTQSAVSQPTYPSPPPHPSPPRITNLPTSTSTSPLPLSEEPASRYKPLISQTRDLADVYEDDLLDIVRDGLSKCKKDLRSNLDTLLSRKDQCGVGKITSKRQVKTAQAFDTQAVAEAYHFMDWYCDRFSFDPPVISFTVNGLPTPTSATAALFVCNRKTGVAIAGNRVAARQGAYIDAYHYITSSDPDLEAIWQEGHVMAFENRNSTSVEEVDAILDNVFIGSKREVRNQLEEVAEGFRSRLGKLVVS